MIGNRTVMGESAGGRVMANMQGKEWNRSNCENIVMRT